MRGLAGLDLCNRKSWMEKLKIRKSSTRVYSSVKSLPECCVTGCQFLLTGTSPDTMSQRVL